MGKERTRRRQAFDVNRNGLFALNHHLLFVRIRRRRIDQVRCPRLLIAEAHAVGCSGLEHAVSAAKAAADDEAATDDKATADDETTADDKTAANHEPAADDEAAANHKPVGQDVAAIRRHVAIDDDEAAVEDLIVVQLKAAGQPQAIRASDAINTDEAVIDGNALARKRA